MVVKDDDVLTVVIFEPPTRCGFPVRFNSPALATELGLSAARGSGNDEGLVFLVEVQVSSKAEVSGDGSVVLAHEREGCDVFPKSSLGVSRVDPLFKNENIVCGLSSASLAQSVLRTEGVH